MGDWNAYEEIALAELIIHTQLEERLRAIAEREHRPVEEVLSDLIERYDAQPEGGQSGVGQPFLDPLAAMEGMFDDDVTDLSTTVDRTMAAYYGSKYGRAD